MIAFRGFVSPREIEDNSAVTDSMSLGEVGRGTHQTKKADDAMFGGNSA